MLAALLFATLLSAAPPATAALPTVAVLYFDTGGDDDALAVLKKGLAQMLISDLAGSERYTVVERTRLEELLAELKLGQTKAIDKGTANRVGKLLGARFLVLGSYFSLFGTLKVDACVVEVETGVQVRCVGDAGKPDEFMEIEQTLSAGLDGILSNALPPRTDAGAAPSPSPSRKPRAAPPKQLGLDTALRYGKALDAADRGDKATAKTEMQAVVAAAPDFTLAALDLASLVQ